MPRPPADALACERLLALYARAVERLLADVPEGDGVRALAAWQEVERRTAFVRHLLEDAKKDKP